MDNLNVLENPLFGLRETLLDVLAKINDEQEYKIQELFAYLTSLNFQIINYDEVKNYLLKDKILFANFRYVCKRIKEEFSDIESYSIKLYKDSEDSTYNSIYIILNNKNDHDEDLLDRILEFYNDKVFNFLCRCDSYIQICEKGGAYEL